ncbi:holocytochrome c synthase [Leucoagaricus gongylophorus]
MGQATSTPTSQNASSLAASTPAKCPVEHSQLQAGTSRLSAAENNRASTPAQCPVDHGKTNPLNQIPDLANGRQPGQTMKLPTERVESSIPRDGSEKWEYPSPQQFYNALVRKGWETPEEHIEVMVDIHNFLNEEAWREVQKWEKRQYDGNDLQLTRLRGRPGELSPKARFHMLAGWVFPSRFSSEPPFDRHDWVVRRPKTGEEVRYVIDYYTAPSDPDGSPVFSLDVRPALDSFGSLKERIAVATGDAWAAFRERETPPSREPHHQ